MTLYRFKTRLNIFEASVNADESFVKIGGDRYRDCINVALVKRDGVPIYAKIPHLESEPECGVAKFLDKTEKDSTVDFICGSLQFIHHLYPSITRFEFMDDSKIECGIQNALKPPRKIAKPLSLAHLYIAKYGSSWYETKFNAKLINQTHYAAYRDATKVLFQEHTMKYSEFKGENSLSDEQDRILEPLYNSSTTWIEFFNAVPKESHCECFLLWLPFFINKLLKDSFIQNTWYIDIETMPKTDMVIITPNAKGGRRTRKSLRQSKSMRFSNNLSYGSLE
jgi:hypothetical protein